MDAGLKCCVVFLGKTVDSQCLSPISRVNKYSAWELAISWGKSVTD